MSALSGESYQSPSPSVAVDADWARDRGPQPTPSQRLLVAIVRRAVWDFVLYKECNPKTDPDKYGLADDAAGWLFWDGEEATDPEGRYSFKHICMMLDLDPKQIRDASLRLTRDDIQRLNNNIKEE